MYKSWQLFIVVIIYATHSNIKSCFSCLLSEAQINIALYYLLDFGAPVGVPWKEGL